MQARQSLQREYEVQSDVTRWACAADGANAIATGIIVDRTSARTRM
jgi:hypothetical protein